MRDALLVAATLAFLLAHAPVSAAILALFSVVTYFGTCKPPVSGLRASALCGVILAVLVYYKTNVYLASGHPIEDAMIPIGLSYYSFRCFHYVFEQYRETLPEHGFADYLAYLWFLPTIIVGPINRAPAFFADRRAKTWNTDDLSYGIERIVQGYAKTFILGFWLVNGRLGDYHASIPEASESWKLYVEIVRNGLLLYFLFAGASDIAIGFARLLGYKIIENFNWPYFARNISEFWRKWHISLSSWCRDYVYLPVLGATRNPYVATLASFTTIGLWHEISYRYVLWGAWHGIGILGWRQWQMFKRRWNLPEMEHPLGRPIVTGLSVLLTVHYVWFGLVLVNRPTLGQSLAVYRTVLFGWW